jgi:hypothetical protein
VTTGEEVSPRVADDGVPLCSDRCPSHDGKRCVVLGHQPGRICEPAVVEMARLLRERA